LSAVPDEPRIAVLLPYAEGFGPAQAGAIALGVRDITRASRFRHATRIFGRAVEPAFEGLDFRALEPALRPLLNRNLGLAEAFRRALAGSRDVLVELHNRPNMFHYLALVDRRLPLAVRLANDPFTMRHGSSRRARARILKRAEAVYCVSEFVRRRFLDGLEDRAGRTHVIPNGIDRRLDRPPDKDQLILFVGRLIEGKGVAHLVDALAQVLPRHPDWRALLIGASRPGATTLTPFEEAMRARCRGLGGAVRCLGFRTNDEVLEHFRQAAIVVVPSLVDEALSRTAIEGLAAGAAVIGYASGGIPEAIGARGIVLEDKTPARLAMVLEQLIDDDARRGALQRAAWEDYPFGIGAMAARYDQARERALERIARRRADEH
jgi:glycosyltransferase involved in cell wall biosynthesis